MLFFVDDVTCFDRFGVSVYVPVRFDLECLGLRLFATVMVVVLQILGFKKLTVALEKT